jgi:trk system potassium uptake protein TrkA
MKKITKEKGTFGVIGLGRFGSALAQGLAASGAEVIVADQVESKVNEARAYTEFAYVIHNLSKQNLEDVGFGTCDAVIICIGALDVSLLTAMNLLALGVKRVMAKAVSREHGQLLEKIGAEMVFPERDMGARLAQRLTGSSLMDYIRLNNEMDIAECPVPRKLVGVRITDSNLRQKYGINVVAIQSGSKITTHIEPGYPFKKTDSLVILGRSEDILRFHADLDD